MANLLRSTYSTEIYLHSDHRMHTSHSCSLFIHSRKDIYIHTNIYIMIIYLLVSLYTQFHKDHSKRMPH